MGIIEGYYTEKFDKKLTEEYLRIVVDEILSYTESQNLVAWHYEFLDYLKFENHKSKDLPKVRKYAVEYVRTFLSYAQGAKKEVKDNINRSVKSLLDHKFNRAIAGDEHYVVNGLADESCIYYNSLHGLWAFGIIPGIVGSIIAIFSTILTWTGNISKGKKQYEELCTGKNSIEDGLKKYKFWEAQSEPVQQRVENEQENVRTVNEMLVSAEQRFVDPEQNPYLNPTNQAPNLNTVPKAKNEDFLDIS